MEKPASYLYGLAKCDPDGFDLNGDLSERILLASKFIPCAAKDAFLAQALGKSMEPKIHEGDYIIAKKQEDAMNDAVIICILIKTQLQTDFLEKIKLNY